MRKLFLFFLLIVVIFIFFYFGLGKRFKPNTPHLPLNSQISPVTNVIAVTESDIPQLSTVAEGLDTPWAIVFLPDQSMLVTERPGRVRLVDKNGNLQETPVATLTNVKEIGEGGLLGMTLHPDFAKASSGKPDSATNNFIYFYYTYAGDGNNTFNRVVRMVYKDRILKDEKIIVDKIPGNSNHNGGRIKFGPDKFLYITTGDAQNPSQAQDKNSLAGKILRVTDEGKPAPGNPFDSAQGKPFEKLVYSYGHRNPQGLTWDKEKRLWSTEHGRSGIQSGFDELNLIESGKNYGWQIIQGDQTKEGMVTPVLNSGPNTTWAPAGADFAGSSIFFGGLRGETLYEVKIEGNKARLTEHFKGEFGRIREVITGPDGMIYITTSNRDGRGIPVPSDDRIIKINPKKL